MKRKMKLLLLGVMIGLALGLTMIDVLHQEGDHTSHLVIAPYPTWRFFQGGGEEGSWEREHPGKTLPWWKTGKYILLQEVTDS